MPLNNPPAGSIKAWANIVGLTMVAGSGISNFVTNSQGNFTVTFSANMPSTNYIVLLTANDLVIPGVLSKSIDSFVIGTNLFNSSLKNPITLHIAVIM